MKEFLTEIIYADFRRKGPVFETFKATEPITPEQRDAWDEYMRKGKS
jgi:hypothetical protein